MPGGLLTAKEKIHFPNLDGLRFFSFLAVFLVHSFYTRFESVKAHPLHRFATSDFSVNGYLGVNFFFVLSGFLITYLLLKEKETRGQVDVRSFYIRRILRIWPLFYLIVFFGFFVFPWLGRHLGATVTGKANLWSYLLFWNNFDLIENGPAGIPILTLLWSIAIEEQFYLCWPLIIRFTPQRFYKLVFLAIITASIVFRALHVGDARIYGWHTLAVISDMAMGGLGAYYAFTTPSFLSTLKNLSRWSISGIYLLAGSVFFGRQYIFTTPALQVIERLVISGIFLMIILEQNFAGNSLFKMSSFPRATKLGQYTYGLYCYHIIAITATSAILKRLGWDREAWQVVFLATPLALAMAIGIATASYNLFEKRLLKLKARFAYVRQ